MRDINQRRGTTFVFSTHDQRLLDHMQRRIQLHDGRIQLQEQEVA
jgi:putative ABC transport system ATP-binding protein